MHKYRNKKLPDTFLNLFTEISCTDETQTRHNDYNYMNKAALKRNLENFPLKTMISTWNNLTIDLKSTADELEFVELLKENYLSKYSHETERYGPSFSCNNE